MTAWGRRHSAIRVLAGAIDHVVLEEGGLARMVVGWPGGAEGERDHEEEPFPPGL